MKGCCRIFGVAAVLLFLTVPVSYAADPASGVPGSGEPQQMQDFSLSGYGQNGQKTWEVAGASMDMVGNEIKINDITAKMFGDKENMVVTADKGHFDKQTGIVRLTENVKAVTDGGTQLNTDSLDWSQKDQTIKTDEKVNITRDNMTAEGTGVEAKPDIKVAKFEKDVVLTIEEEKKAQTPSANAPPAGQVQPFGGKGPMVITCDGPMELSYDKQLATFYKNVKIDSDGGQGTMIADKMTVRFSSATKQIDTIEAEGHVQITRGESTSYSESAVFTNANKTVLLAGRPKLVIYTDSDSAGALTFKNASP